MRRTRAGKRVVFRLQSDEPEIEALLRWALGQNVAASGRPGGPGLEPRLRDELGSQAGLEESQVRSSKGSQKSEPNSLQINELEDYLL